MGEIFSFFFPFFLLCAPHWLHFFAVVNASFGMLLASQLMFVHKSGEEIEVLNPVLSAVCYLKEWFTSFIDGLCLQLYLESLIEAAIEE